MRHPLKFPNQSPPEYLKLAKEPVFDAQKHLQLEHPDKITSVVKLGYSQEIINTLPSDFGVCSAFRVLSCEGAALMYDVCKQMETNKNEAGGTGKSRVGSFIRGAGYRSQFVKDFCEAPELAEHLSQITSVRLGHHSIHAVACGINYAPEDISKAVDNWHVDSVSFDMVMMIVDPSTLNGGEFQYFKGTKEEGMHILGIDGEEGGLADLPADRVQTVNFPAAGYAFMQQGNVIFHRACKLHEKAERITMIPSFNVLDSQKPDYTNYKSMLTWSDTGLVSEIARHEAWLAQSNLQHLIDDISLFASKEEVAKHINQCVERLCDYAEQLQKK